MSDFVLDLDGGGYVHAAEWNHLAFLNDILHDIGCFIVPKGKDKIVDYYIMGLLNKDHAIRIGELEFEESTFFSWFKEWPDGQEITNEEFEDYKRAFSPQESLLQRARMRIGQTRPKWRSLSFLGRKKKFSKGETITGTDIQMPKIYLKMNVIGNDCYFMPMSKIYSEGRRITRNFSGKEDVMYIFSKNENLDYTGIEKFKEYLTVTIGSTKKAVIRQIKERRNKKNG